MGTEILYIISVTFGVRRNHAMAQAVICWPLPQRPGFNTRLIHLRFVVDRVALGQFFFFFASKYANFLLPESFHQCSTLSVTYMLLLPEKQIVKVWEPSKKQKKWGIGYKSTFTFFSYVKGLGRKHEIAIILIVKPLMYFRNCLELFGTLVPE